ncbi:MAG: SGNH/GDSL hydrolase family protein [Opitutaceae bacterium]|jgi:lysophospholipase L1-like esterase|nr:SGNH/GDSL hydrolase family protein [Opitutaceae bacterium]
MKLPVISAILLGSVCLATADTSAAPALQDGSPPTTAEPVLFIRTANGKPEGRLLFQPKRLLRAYAFNPDREFPVTDFILDGRKITHAGHEPIPHWTEHDFVSPEKTDTHEQPHADGKRYILYGGHRLFADRQIHFDYETDEPWRGPIPRDQSANLPRLHRKIRNHEPIVLTILGDSISQGCDSTAWSNVPPKLPPYRDLLARAIRQASGASVTLRNLAVGGKATPWGVEQTGAVARTKPDLLVIAFGMNDSSARRPDKTFVRNITAIMDGVRTDCPDTEFLLVSGMTPNPFWAHSHPEYLETYHKSLQKLAGPHVAVGDVRTTWLHVLERKGFFDLTGNGINHPNDYGHRLYANVLARTILGPREPTFGERGQSQGAQW